MYVFTDNLGNPLSLSDLTRGISIDNLIQPVRTDQNLGEMTGQTSMIYPGLTNPLGGNDFAGSS